VAVRFRGLLSNVELYAVRCYFERPGDYQCERETDGNQQNEKPPDPVREGQHGHENADNLQYEPRDDDVRDPHFEDASAFEFVQKRHFD
jgi:hypothetical protein